MIRKARIDDVKSIQGLINLYADQGKMLSKSLQNIYEHTRDFIVYEDKEGRVIACCAAQIIWAGLAEIKSLAVAPEYSGKGIATDLVLKSIKELKPIGIVQVFALTYVDQFFQRLGFRVVERESLPHKVWRECIHCSFFPDCNEVAVIYDIKS